MNYYLQRLIAFFRRPANNDFEIPAELLPYITPFGSRIWGGYTANSDVDLLAKETDSTEICQILTNLGIKWTTEIGYSQELLKIVFTFNSFRFEINLWEEQAYEAQLTAIPVITTYFQSRPIPSKNYRIEVYEAFRNYFLFHEKLPSYMYQHLLDHYPEYCI